MARITTLALALLACLPAAAHADGTLDPGYGSDGRSVLGSMESDSLRLRGIAQSPFGAIWLFGDDAKDRAALYVARLHPDGQPDAAFGPGNDGRRRTVLPPALTVNTEALALRGSVVQMDGKPLVYGGLRAIPSEGGVFPGVVCRLAVAGNLDPAFGTSGCALLRSHLAAEETCLVEDLVEGAGGMLYAVGNCSGPDLPSRPFLARLTSSGVGDVEFAAGVGMVTPLHPLVMHEHHFTALALQPDGLVVVGGHFRTNLGERADLDLGVLRFDGGGSIDPGFGVGGLALVAAAGEQDEFARDLVLRPDGKVLLLGQRTDPAPLHAVALLAQLHADGSTDLAWGNQGVREDAFGEQLGMASTLRSLALDPSGRAVVAGTRSGAPTLARTVAGTEFWVAFPRSPADQPPVELWFTGETATSGVVSNAMHGIEQPFTVTPGLPTRVLLSADIELLGPSDSTEDKGLQVTTHAPVTATAVSGGEHTPGGSVLLPRATLGSDYRVLAWGEGLGAFGSFLALAASEIDTLVTITPSIATTGLPQGVPYQRFLQPGQAYHLEDSDGDLSGSVISADKPLAVFGGHSCAHVPADSTWCDLLSEQLLPTSGWGQQFFVLPFAGQPEPLVVRVIAGTDDTEVRVDGVVHALLADRGLYEFTTAAPVQVTTSAPASVARYASGCSLPVNQADDCPGDPAMSGVLPTSQWVARHAAVVPARPITDQHYLSLVVPVGAIAQVAIDGAMLPPGAFTAIGASGHASAQIPVTHGANYLVTAPVPIGVDVHGFGNADAFAFPASASSAGEDPDADDLVVRYLADGERDPHFGNDGLVLVGHAAAHGATLPSFDAGLRAIASGDTVLVGSASSNGHTEQHFFVSYRLQAGGIFKDGFE